MNVLELFLLWLFAPTVLVVLLAIVLSVLGIKPPKPRDDGWFGPYQ